jgi:hypothetical protein
LKKINLESEKKRIYELLQLVKYEAFHLGACEVMRDDVMRDGEANSLPGNNFAVRLKNFSLQKARLLHICISVKPNGIL